MSFQVVFADAKTRGALRNLKERNFVSVQVRCEETSVAKLMIAVLSDDQVFVDFYDEIGEQKQFTWHYEVMLSACRAAEKKSR